MAFGCGTSLNARLRQLCKRNCTGTAWVIFTCPGAHPDGPRHWTRALTPHRTTQMLGIMQPFIYELLSIFCLSIEFLHPQHWSWFFHKGYTDTHNNIGTCVHTQTRTQNSPSTHTDPPHCSSWPWRFQHSTCNYSRFQRRPHHTTDQEHYYHFTWIQYSLKDSDRPLIRNLWNQNLNCLEILCT